MAKTRKPKDDENKLIQDRIQKQYEDVFPEQNAPPSHLSLRQVESLKARIADLEEKLSKQPGLVEGKSTSTAAQRDTQSLDTSAVQPPKHEDVIYLWRERLVNFILRGSIALGFIALIAIFAIATQRQNWRDPIVGLIVYAILIGITFLKTPYRVRAYGLIALVFALYLNSLTQSGVRGDANIFLLTVITLTLMLLGLRAGVVILGIGILAMIGVGWGVVNQQISLRDLFDQLNFSTWISHGIVAYMLTGIIATGILMLQSEFSAAQQREQTATDEIYEERVHLVERVKERTHDLELASEVGRTVSEKVENLSEMLTAAVDMIRARFNLYYAQIYLTDPSEKNITLRAGTGDVGKELLQRGHHLLIASGSLNGRAASEKRSVIVADTKDSPNFLPNPLLPKTRSEMAIPLIVSGKVVGVLDVQSEQPGALNETNLPAFEALAGQLAIAVENAALFAQAEEARTAVEEQVRRLTQQGWREFLDAIERGQKIGYAFEQSQVIRLQPEALATKDRDFSIPITVTGTKIGEIRLPVEQDHAWTTNELELIKATSAQLAQHVENLRLLAQAERFRIQAEQAVQRLTHEGWDNFLQTHGELEPGYVFDRTDVKSLSQKGNDPFEYAIKHPMVVGNQIIGELAVDIPNQSHEAAEVIAAVAEQLSGHIENLRLSELNERHAQQEKTLRQITSALRSSNNPATIMRTAVREVGKILSRKTLVQMAASDQAGASPDNGNGPDPSMNRTGDA